MTLLSPSVPTLANHVAQHVARLDGATVVLAGAGGLIARHLASELARLANETGVHLTVVCLVRDLAKAEAAYRGLPGVQLAQQTLGEPLRYQGPADHIIHCGGASNPQDFARRPYQVAAANLRAVFDLVDLAQRCSTARIGYLSSREVYGDARPDTGELAEPTTGVFDHLSVRNAYPESKRATETVLAAAAAELGLSWQAYRLSSVYGPGMRLADDGRAMSDLLQARLAGRDLVLTGDGTAVRSYCYAPDAARGVLTALLAGTDGPYNVANEDEPVTIAELARLIADAPVPGTDRPQVLVTGTQPAPAGYSTFGYLPTATKKLRDLGWQPQVCLADGIRHTLASFQDRP